MNRIALTLALGYLLTSHAAVAASNPLNEKFAALDASERAASISQMLSSRGKSCPSIQREMYQGQLPDGLALWSFSCFAGSDYQVVILPSQDVQVIPCEEIAKNRNLLACFTAVPSK